MGNPRVDREVLESATIVVKTSQRTFEFEVTASGLRTSEVSINFEPVGTDDVGETFDPEPASDLNVQIELEGVHVVGSVAPRADRPPFTN